jgi:biopolymer transport protein ExbB
VKSALQRASRNQRAEALSIKRGTGLLASVGSTGPFIGLFGTVWGIAEQLHRHFKAQTTNLASSRPASPKRCSRRRSGSSPPSAVLIYNHLARQATAYLELVSNLSGELLRIVSYDLDRAGRTATTKIHAAE